MIENKYDIWRIFCIIFNNYASPKWIFKNIPWFRSLLIHQFLEVLFWMYIIHVIHNLIKYFIKGNFVHLLIIKISEYLGDLCHRHRALFDKHGFDPASKLFEFESMHFDNKAGWVCSSFALKKKEFVEWWDSLKIERQFQKFIENCLDYTVCRITD